MTRVKCRGCGWSGKVDLINRMGRARHNAHLRKHRQPQLRMDEQTVPATSVPCPECGQHTLRRKPAPRRRKVATAPVSCKTTVKVRIYYDRGERRGVRLRPVVILDSGRGQNRNSRRKAEEAAA